MSTVIKIAILTLLSSAYLTQDAAAQGAQTRTIAITDEAGLQFGAFVAPPAGGTVTLAPDGTRTVAAVIAVGSEPYGAARFTVTIDSSNPHYTISIPSSITLTSGGGSSMTVDQIVSDPAGAGFVQPPGRIQTLSVGGRLNIGPSQPAGTYSGYVTVTVNL